MIVFVDQSSTGELPSVGPEGEGREREEEICEKEKSSHVCCMYNSSMVNLATPSVG